MRYLRTKNFVFSAALVAALGIAGCNLFNPTEDVNIKSDDANALTYEGYIKFRNNEYTAAAEYFNKAIAADSTHSEAWYGLAKAKLNIQGLNTFELMKYVNTAGGATQIPLANMDDATALRYQVGIDTVVTFLKEFIYRDTTGRLDGVVTFKTISESYVLLNMVNTMITLRETTSGLAGCAVPDPETGAYNCDMGSMLNSLKGGKINETVDGLHEVFSTCESNPEMMATAAGQAIPLFGSMLSNEGQNTTASVMCGAMADMTADSGDPDENEKAISAVIAVSGYSDFSDDDGDGCYDEEILDGMDNDGDGLIDEDLRDVNDHFLLDHIQIGKNSLIGKKDKKDMLLYTSFSPNDKYKDKDLDRNGEIGSKDGDEWNYVYSKYADREANSVLILGEQSLDYRLKFAEKLVFNPSGLPKEEFLAMKKAIAADKDGVYGLSVRKEIIGGCWANYTEKMFQEWLEEHRR